MLAAKRPTGVQFYTDSLLQVRHDQLQGKRLRKAPGSQTPFSASTGEDMHFGCLRVAVAFLGVAFLNGADQPTVARNIGPKAADRPPIGDAGTDGSKIDIYIQAEKVLGGAAANPECLWLGTRVVSLLRNDDLDTALRHLDLYDRFSCPAGHIQMAFRCVVRQGNIDRTAPNSLHRRIEACWINPDVDAIITPPASASAAEPAKIQ
jgi:hypothetical protein